MTKVILFLFASLPLTAATITIDCGSATDQYFSGGYAVSIANPPAGVPATMRSSPNGAGKSFSYRIRAPDPGPYSVTLTFVEPAPPSTGKRLFGLRINEQPAIDQINLFGVAGALKPVYRSFLAYPAEGAINLQFVTVAYAAVVSRITINPFSQYVVFQEPERVQVTGAVPVWMGGYYVPRPAQVTDTSLAIVYQNVVVSRNGLRQVEGTDYTVAAAMFQLVVKYGELATLAVDDTIRVDYTRDSALAKSAAMSRDRRKFPNRHDRKKAVRGAILRAFVKAVYVADQDDVQEEPIYNPEGLRIYKYDGKLHPEREYPYILDATDD